MGKDGINPFAAPKPSIGGGKDMVAKPPKKKTRKI
jgi:hypothetical protein